MEVSKYSELVSVPTGKLQIEVVVINLDLESGKYDQTPKRKAELKRWLDHANHELAWRNEEMTPVARRALIEH